MSKLWIYRITRTVNWRVGLLYLKNGKLNIADTLIYDIYNLSHANNIA